MILEITPLIQQSNALVFKMIIKSKSQQYQMNGDNECMDGWEKYYELT